MSQTRRDFIRSVGVAVATLIMRRCNPLPPICYEAVESTAVPTPFAGGDDSPRGKLRAYWMVFGDFAQQTKDESEALGESEEARDALIEDHHAVLNELVATADLDRAVAEEVQAAFSGAVYHVWRANIPATCYAPTLVDYTPTSAQQLVQQAEILAELEATSDLDEETIARATAAIERDIAFLSLSQTDVQALYDELIAAAGDSYAYPSFETVELDITPEAIEAAHFLVELLLQ